MMQKLVIGFDLDRTLINFVDDPVVRAAYDLGIKEYPKEKVFNYSNLSKKHYDRIHELFDDPVFMGIGNVRCDFFDRYSLLRLKEDGHRLVIITARKKSVAKATENLVNQFFPEVNKLIICEHTADKRQYMIDEKLSVWVDDSPEGIKIAVELGIPTFMIKTPYFNEKDIEECYIYSSPLTIIDSVTDFYNIYKRFKTISEWENKK